MKYLCYFRLRKGLNIHMLSSHKCFYVTYYTCSNNVRKKIIYYNMQ